MKVIVLGIGNIMFYDEGVGVHFVEFIRKKYKFHSSDHDIEFIDGGTLAHFLTPIISNCNKLIVVDCIDADDCSVGDTYFFDFDNIPAPIKWNGSAHEIEMLQTLEMMELLGDRPQTKILGVIPMRIEPMCIGISEKMQLSIKLMEKTLLNYLLDLGFKYDIISDITIQDEIARYKDRLYDPSI